jgi:putative endonuclease
MQYYVYLVECSDKTFYCGYTTDLAARLKEHNEAKTGAKYTRSRRPVKLCYFEKLSSKSLAMKREIEIKKLSRMKKERLILPSNCLEI